MATPLPVTVPRPALDCRHFEAGTCRSCTLLDVPQDEQVRASRAMIEDLLAPFAADDETVWQEPIRSAPSRFRSKAKMVVRGTTMNPVLGIAGDASSPGAAPESGQDASIPVGDDLSDCPLYPEGVEELLGAVRALIRRAQIPPYDVARRRGELKHVIVTASPDGEFMLRFVLRTEGPLPRLREHLPALLDAFPAVRVVSANLHPEHRAVLEGAREIHLAGEASLPIRIAGSSVVLHARPQSFLQTNPEVAARLYTQVRAWIDDIEGARDPGSAPLRVWDLYCGLGGFALHAASPAGPGAREVTGVEIAAAAVASAQESADDANLAVGFLAADATTWAIEEAERTGAPDVVVVNPPRRGLGPDLADWIEGSGASDVLYSSCNPATLAQDLARMPSYRIIAGQLVEMFPHTRHDEVLVRLRRI